MKKNKPSTGTGNPCGHCRKPMRNKIMTVIAGSCWQCGKPMNIVYISCDPPAMIRGYSHLPPSGLTEDEKVIARSKGVILNTHYSATMQESYSANTCSHCNTFCGNFYLFNDYISPAYSGKLSSESFIIGEICDDCENVEEEEP